MRRSKVKSKRLELAPYPGVILLYRTLADLRVAYAEHTGEAYPYNDEAVQGRYIQILPNNRKANPPRYLVYARTADVLAHELSHVILITFEECGIDPACGKGEPFCYLLSALMIQAGATGAIK